MNPERNEIQYTVRRIGFRSQGALANDRYRCKAINTVGTSKFMGILIAFILYVYEIGSQVTYFKKLPSFLSLA